MISDNCRITIREFDDDVGISFGSCQAIFMDAFGMKHARAKIVLKLLKIGHRSKMLTVSNNDPNLLKKS